MIVNTNNDFNNGLIIVLPTLGIFIYVCYVQCEFTALSLLQDLQITFLSVKLDVISFNFKKELVPITKGGDDFTKQLFGIF